MTKTHTVFTVIFPHFIHSSQGVPLSKVSVQSWYGRVRPPAPGEASDSPLPWSQLTQWRNTTSPALPSALTAPPWAGTGCNHSQKDKLHPRGRAEMRGCSHTCPSTAVLAHVSVLLQTLLPKGLLIFCNQAVTFRCNKSHRCRLEQPQSSVTGGSRLGEAAQGLKTLYELWKVHNKNSI